MRASGRAGRLASDTVRRRNDEAWVLATQQLGDSDVIVSLFARQAGLVRGVAPGARRSRRRFGGALEPLTRVRARWAEREGRDLHRIEELDPIRSYARMQADPRIQAACAVMAEVARATVREEQEDTRVFRLIGAVLDALEAGLEPYAALRYFEFWSLRLHGLLPDLERCGTCLAESGPRSRRWVAARFGLLCGRCRAQVHETTRLLGAADREFLEAARNGPPDAVGDLAGRARPGGPLELLLRGTLEGFVERGFRSYRHLDSVSG